MTGNESLNKIIEYIGTHQDQEIAEAINILRQNQEHLETLEKEKQATIKLMELMALDNDIVESALILDKYQQENEKLKKAIEIMRNKKVNILFLFLHKLEDYNFLVWKKYQLTQEEYDLLKEVLV